MKIDRLVSIIMVLLEHDKVSAKSLSEMFEVSLRTIYRDVESINLAGIPIISTPGIGGGFQIMNEYKVDKKIFSSSDIVTLLKGLGSISSMEKNEDVLNTLAKIKSLIPKDQANEIEIKSNQMVIDLNPWKGNSDLLPSLNTIKSAINNQNIIFFKYYNGKSEISSRNVEPHSLVLKNNHWYVQGFCQLKQDFRLFKLSRILNIETLEEKFEHKEIPKAFSKFHEEMTKRQLYIKLLIHESLVDKILDYCNINSLKEYDNNHYIANFPFIDDDYGYSILLGFGDKCECLEPQNVRNELIKRINSMINLYNK